MGTKDRTSLPVNTDPDDEREEDIERVNKHTAAQQAAGLRALADLIEANPAFAPHLDQAVGGMSAYVSDTSVLADYARAVVAAGGRIVKDYPGENDGPDRHFRLYGYLGPVSLRLHCVRDHVCERVVTGVETVTTTVPDPKALAEVPTVEVVEQVEQVEWKCRPLLAPELADAGIRVTS